MKSQNRDFEVLLDSLGRWRVFSVAGHGFLAPNFNIIS